VRLMDALWIAAGAGAIGNEPLNRWQSHADSRCTTTYSWN